MSANSARANLLVVFRQMPLQPHPAGDLFSPFSYSVMVCHILRITVLYEAFSQSNVLELCFERDVSHGVWRSRS